MSTPLTAVVKESAKAKHSLTCKNISLSPLVAVQEQEGEQK